MRSHIRLMLILTAAVTFAPTALATTPSPDQKLSPEWIKAHTKAKLPPSPKPSDSENGEEAAVTEKERIKAAPKTSKARLLTLDESRKAFGESFGPEVKDSSFFLYGQSSPACLQKGADGKDAPLQIAVDAKAGTVQVHYDGSNDDCLDFAKAQADLGEGDALVSLKDMTAATLTGDFDSVQLVGPDKPEDLLNSKNEKIAHVSDATVKANAKDDAAKKSEAIASFYESVLEKCIAQGGLAAADMSERAVNILVKISPFMKDKEKEWKEDQYAAIYKLRFDAAKALIEKGGRTKDFSKAIEALDKLVAADGDAYGPKARALYVSVVKKLANSTSATPAEIVDQADPILAKIRELTVEEKDDKQVEDLEKDLYQKQVAQAAKLGSDSDEYAAMSEKFGDFLKAKDDGDCLTDEPSAAYGFMDPARLNVASCRSIALLNRPFAIQNQNAIQIAKNNADMANLSAAYTACQQTAGTNLATFDSNGRQINCASVDARVKEIAKANPNLATNLTGSAWGSTYTNGSTQATQSTASTNTTSIGNGAGGFSLYTPSDSGLLNTGVGAANTQNGVQTTIQNTTQIPQQNVVNPVNPQQNVAPTITNTGGRRTFRG